MSRHRYIRNLDISEELKDDALSDGGGDELDDADNDRMMEGLEQIRDTIGSEEDSGISDRDVKDTLYYYHFDLQKSIAWLLEEQERKNAAMERRDPGGKLLPLLPEETRYSTVQYVSMDAPNQGPDSSGRINVPLIRLAQSQAQAQELYESSESSLHLMRKKLSTIPEGGESTLGSGNRNPVPQMSVARSIARAESTLSTTTDYGEVIERTLLIPDDIPPSPSLSALHRLSVHEPAPSITPTQSRTPSSASLTRSLPDPPVSPLEASADTAGTNSRIRTYLQSTSAQTPPASARATSPPSEPARSEKRSKLSSLASSRSSVSASSRSSSSYSSGSGSAVTYPLLRPASGSLLSVAAGDSSSTTGSSSMSSHVRRAIQTALDLEAVDRTAAAAEHIDVPASPESTVSTIRPEHPIPAPSRGISLPPETPKSSIPPRPTAPLSQDSPDDVARPAAGVVRSVAPPGSRSRPPSKLAALAQAKAQQAHWMPKPKKPPMEPSHPLHKPHTEYLTPIANGSSMTTAITTTYQTLGSLMSPSETIILPSFPPSSLPVPPRFDYPSRHERAAAEQRPSKLAVKSKKALQKHEPETVLPEPHPLPVSPLFSSRATRTRALPSAFASLLLDGNSTLANKGSVNPSSSRKRKGVREQKDHRTHPRDMSDRRRKPTEGEQVFPLPPLSPLCGFAFNVPSPDDVVFNARRGTSLARSGSSSSHYPLSTPSLGSSLHSSVDAAIR